MRETLNYGSAEVADSSIDYDRGGKNPIYARSGIQEVWIVNLQENCLVYRQPTVNRYSGK
ncbi:MULTISPECIES: Uma2 family endonuclease [unclassified Microcoleus]|uniref:Uma2 family endonuclease n=1 Tax=unclassified Microcoleus TaxID=2642155 RepID=UPI0040407AF8